MTRLQLKRLVLTTLAAENLEEIYRRLNQYRDHRLLNPLFIALCNPVERVRWHAICCFGWLVPAMAEEDLEAARIVMRRFLWSLNDESGGIGWGVPETMAEILCHSAPLRQEYLHMLISYMREDGQGLFEDGNFLEMPMLQRGLLWGIGRLCQEHRQEMLGRGIVADVAAYLASTDPYVLGLAIRCLGLLGAGEHREQLVRYRGDPRELTLFIDRRFQTLTVDALAASALASLGTR